MDQSNDSGNKRKREEEFRQALNSLLNSTFDCLQKSKRMRISNGGGCNSAHNAMFVSPPLGNLFHFQIPMAPFPNNGARQVPLQLENGAPLVPLQLENGARQVPLQLENGPVANALQMQGCVISGGAMRVGRNGNCAVIPVGPREEIANVAAGHNDIVAPRHEQHLGPVGMPFAAVLQGEDNIAPQVPDAAPVAVAGVPVAAVLQREDNIALQVPDAAPAAVAGVSVVRVVPGDFAVVLNAALGAVMDVITPQMRLLAEANATAAVASSVRTQNTARMQRERRPVGSIAGVVHYVAISGITTTLSGISSGSAALGNMMSNNGAAAAAPVGENQRVWGFTGSFASVLGTGVARVVSQVASHVASSITQPNLPGNPQHAPDNGQ